MLEFSQLAAVLADAAATPPPTTTLPLHAAIGRVLAAPARATWPLPRFAASAMDGYAVRAAEVATATAEKPVVLPLQGSAYAEPGTPPPLAPGHAMRIATGGAVPAGADGIVPREHADDDGTRVYLRTPAADHIRRVGEEYNAGDQVLAAGTRLGPLQVAALAAAGISDVVVGAAPRLAVLATGSELVPPGHTPGPGQVIDTNGPLIATWLARHLWLPAPQPLRVGDDPEVTRAALEAAFAGADVVLTSGGVSVGVRDVIRPVAAALGFVTVIPRLALKPGKPLWLARRGGQWLIGLPGNPAAVVAGLLTVALPLLKRLEGDTRWWPAAQRLQLAAPLRASPDRTQLVWAERIGETAKPLPRRQSHMLGDLAVADVALFIPPGNGPLPAGTMVAAWDLAL